MKTYNDVNQVYTNNASLKSKNWKTWFISAMKNEKVF